MDKKTFNLWNRIVALAVFVIACVTYLSTIEPTASFWDCGEFIASSYKLEVGHPPGNPVFQLFARIFTIPFPPEKAAVAVNAMNGSRRPSPSSAPAPWAPWPTRSPTPSGSPPWRARCTRCRPW